MATSTHDAYLTNRILSADGVELVRILYGAALGSVESARRHLAAGEIAPRSNSISKAVEILAELNRSLDHARAPELSLRLAELYDYAQRRLLEANFEQSDEPLAEVQKLLATLADAWRQINVSPAASQAEPGGRHGAAGSEGWTRPAAELAPASHGWSF